MDERRLTPLDEFLVGINRALGTINVPRQRVTRANPAGDMAEEPMSDSDRRHAAGLMRVNHAGEVAAQGLYQGHGVISRDPAIAEQMRQAADEEMDHLGWCEQRLAELQSQPSVFSPLWYGGAFAIGALSGMFGDRWSLGFVEETEKQVSEHLSGHLRKLPRNDRRSRAILERMREEEEQHGANAQAAGAASLPKSVREVMRATARVMTRTAYWM